MVLRGDELQFGFFLTGDLNGLCTVCTKSCRVCLRLRYNHGFVLDRKRLLPRLPLNRPFWKCTRKNFKSCSLTFTTLLTPSFGNHLFANYHVLKPPLTNLILSSFYFLKVLKSAAKIMEIGSEIKKLTPKNNLDKFFFHCKNVSMGNSCPLG